MANIEKIILNQLMENDSYSRRVLPFLQDIYFQDKNDRTIFSHIKEFITRYNNIPTREAIIISLDTDSALSQDDYNTCVDKLGVFKEIEVDQDEKWLIDKTEEFCKDKAVYNAIMESIHIIDGQSANKTANAIPEILSSALSVCFDDHIGHDYIEDSDERYDFYHKVESRVPFDLDFFNVITNGGTPNKTLNVCLAGTGVGKSLFMCHHAANCLQQNKNVLYITCEMAEERIAERIDANIMDITIDDLNDLPKQIYDKKMAKIRETYKGKLIVKEYPTATAHAQHFRNLLDELRLKKRFKPDIIFVDYLNICASSRLKSNSNVNSYTYIKAIAEELRGLAVENDVPVFTATQTNRSGFSSTDVGLEDTSESFGLPATADFMFAIISTEELDIKNQILVKQLKNRYNDLVTNRKFVIGINRSKMKLFDVDDKEQRDLINTGQPALANGAGFDGKNYEAKFKDWNV